MTQDVAMCSNHRYSCLMSVYLGDEPEWLRVAMESVLSQTVPPSEFVLVEDGPISDGLAETIERFRAHSPGLFKIVPLEENHGLWYALQEGLGACSNDLVMRMDADDYSEPGRAEAQLAYMAEHPECGCCGTLVIEFEGEVGNGVSLVELPEDHDGIVRFSKWRDPMRHPTMLFRKSAVTAAGGYREMPYFEDYDLVMRLIASGSRLHNIQLPLFRVRTAPDFFARRGGLGYLRHMKHFRDESLARGDITRLEWLFSVAPHAIACLVPNRVRGLIYKFALRKRMA